MFWEPCMLQMYYADAMELVEAFQTKNLVVMSVAFQQYIHVHVTTMHMYMENKHRLAGNFFCCNCILCFVLQSEVGEFNFCGLLTKYYYVLHVKNLCGRKIYRFPKNLP